MNESKNDSTNDVEDDASIKRCTVCDSILDAADDRCLLCGELADVDESAMVLIEDQTVDSNFDEKLTNSDVAQSKEEQNAESSEPQITEDEQEVFPEAIVTGEYVEEAIKERQSPIIILLALGLFIFVCILGFLVLQNPSPASLALFPSPTAAPPTSTNTSTMTPLPSETTEPTDTPTIAATPLPSDTPQPPHTHSVFAGDTIFALSLRYGVSMESIATINGIPVDSGLLVSQQLLIPWPTPTPPLSPVEVEIGGEVVIADPTNCRMYEIKGGDTFFGISARERIELPALMAANRLTEQSVLQPGDQICIPNIIRGDAIPPTAGPSPTPSATVPPLGPHLLYPIEDTVVDLPDQPLFLQWVAVKNLEESEWYMVEVTNLTDVDSHPMRGFTRQTSYRVPGSWHPQVPEFHDYRWRVRLVQVTGEREDGSFTYSFGGENSEDASFSWLGAFPTSTPAPTPTNHATPKSNS